MSKKDLDVAHLPPYDEIWAAAQLEKLRDGVRFRVDGLRPDSLRERPPGYERSMVDVISSYHRGEVAFINVVQKGLDEDSPKLKTRFAALPADYVQYPFEEVGSLMNAREHTLAVIRNIIRDDWNRTINDPDAGLRTIRELIIERAHADKEFLDLLEHMRYALQGSMRPFTRTISGSALPDPSR